MLHVAIAQDTAVLECEGDNCLGLDGVSLCNADMNRDGSVGVQDVLFVLAAYHGDDSRADIDGTGDVGI
eukprot:SAG31_NODE_27065_length_432_cov_0.480480_1_plen_68_part_10